MAHTAPIVQSHDHDRQSTTAVGTRSAATGRNKTRGSQRENQTQYRRSCAGRVEWGWRDDMFFIRAVYSDDVYAYAYDDDLRCYESMEVRARASLSLPLWTFFNVIVIVF